MKRILICGAGIAGPSLAFWMSKLGWEVTVLEKAPMLRPGGQAVDFRGPVHREVLERMGLWDAIHERRTHATDVAMLRRDGSTFATLPKLMMGGDVEILRGDLAQLLYEHTRERAHYRFGIHITALEQTSHDVRVQLSNGASEIFDLVVGADGLHSAVRRLAFGDESRFVKHHGHRVATCALKDTLSLAPGSYLYTVPGRGLMLNIEPRGSRALCIFDTPDVPDAFGWHTAPVLEQLRSAPDLYVDDISSVFIDGYVDRRVVLLGDAAWGGTLGGQGTSLAVVGAYVLASALEAGTLPRYEQRMRPYASECQKGAKHVGGFFAPHSTLGLWVRNAMYALLTSRLFIRRFEKLVTGAATAFELAPKDDRDLVVTRHDDVHAAVAIDVRHRH